MDFSSLVDIVAKEAGRPFDTEAFARIVNRAIRYVERSTDSKLLRREELLPQSGMNQAIVWRITNLKQFMRIVYAEDCDGTPATETQPSVTMTQHRRSGLPYYYQSGCDVVFGNTKQGVRFSWACHSPWFKYHKVGDRTLYWGEDECWEGPQDQVNMDKVTSPTLIALHALVEERALQSYFNRSDNPASDNQDRETARVWNNETAAGA